MNERVAVVNYRRWVMCGCGVGVSGAIFCIALMVGRLNAATTTPALADSQASVDKPAASSASVESPSATSSTATPSTAAPSTATSSSHTPAGTKGTVSTYGIPQVEYINQLVRKGWADHNLTPSAPASDAEWCRRVYLDVIGRIPKVEELNKFLADKSHSKRADLVARLLGDGYVEEYARNWTTVWENILVGRVGNKKEEARSPVSREGMAQYLRRSFEKNKPYDKMVEELISATGNNTPGEEGFNGAVNFLTGKMEDNGVLATAKTAQIFMGLQVQCTQCHNHPFNDWKQNRFWEMNAFFRQTKAVKTMEGKKQVDFVVLSNTDFRGEGGDPNNAELYYELRNGIMKVAYPVFVDGKEISKSGYLKDTDRRTELAKLVVGSEFLSRAIVNRMWGHFMGFGFTKPVDDMGPHNPASNPDLLEHLATDFGKHQYGNDGYNLKELIRWIVLSEPYSLSSHMTSKNRGDDPSLGEQPQFSHFYLRQMQAEELYESLLVATAAEKTRGSEEQQEAAKSQWLSQFVIAFGTDDGGETTTFNGSIPQTLMMFNGDLIKRATSANEGSFLDQVAHNSKLSSLQKIDYLYMAGLARMPNRNEVEYAEMLRKDRKGDATAALQDVWWAVLNSNEFILNH